MTPDEHWDIVLGLSAVDSEVEEVVAPFGDIITDTEFPNAPGYSFNYLARYNWDTLGGNMAVQLDGTYDDDQYLEVSNNSQSLQEAGGIVNARIRYTSEDEHWSVTGWVQNLTDEERKSYTLDLGILGVTGVYAPPRWYGVTLNYKF
ncbi:MAG: TonB-dependent receptor [Exilibacterium sp.]